MNEGQPTPTFIQALAAQISGFVELLNTLKASHRQQYSSLLQQEQQLLQQLGSFNITDDYQPSQQEGYAQDGSEQQDVDAFSPSHAVDSTDKQRRRSSTDSHARATNSRRQSAAFAGTASSVAEQSSSGNLLPEVVSYDNLLAKNGPTGGWHPDDHNTFMSILRSNR